MKRVPNSISNYWPLLVILLIIFITARHNSNITSFWDAVSAIANIVIGFSTITLNHKIHIMQARQNKLYMEPHAILNNIYIKTIEPELSNSGKEFKSIKDFDYPFYIDKNDDLDIKNSVLIVLKFINTSEAFARLRFVSATFQNQNLVASYGFDTIGTHINHIVLSKDHNDTPPQIGLLINSKRIPLLIGTKISLSFFFKNNFGDCYKETQHYFISHLVDESVSFYPCNFQENSFENYSD